MLGNDLWPIPSGIKGDIFCRFTQQNFFTRLLWKYSILVVLAMTVERWYAITHPVIYKVVYKGYNVFLQLISTLVFSLLILLPALFQVHVGTQGTQQICIINALMDSTALDQTYVLIYSIVTVFVPFVIISTLYLHLCLIVIGQQVTPSTHAQLRRRELEKRLLRMNAAVAAFLGICFTPSQMCQFLHRFGVVDLFVVRASAIVGMLNSIFNPWIYYFTNLDFRKEMLQLFCLCNRLHSNTIVHPDKEESFHNTTTIEEESFNITVCEMEKKEVIPMSLIVSGRGLLRLPGHRVRRGGKHLLRPVTTE